MKVMFNRIIKNLFNKPATRLYPVTERKPFERTRGRIYFESQNCIYCGICQRKCPSDAISVDRKTSTWKLNAFRCIICGECAVSCPKKCIDLTNERRHPSDTKKIICIQKETEADTKGA